MRSPRPWAWHVSLVVVLLATIGAFLPVKLRTRTWILVAFAVLTAAAWLMEDDIRRLLGSPFTD